VVPLTDTLVSDAAGVLARSHRQDPACVYLLPDTRRRVPVLTHIFGQWCDDALSYASARCAVLKQRVLGVSVWFPVGAFPPSRRRELRALPAYLRPLLLDARGTLGFARYIFAAAREHPCAREHMYLAIVGVDDGWRGQGIGTVLLAHTLADADATATPSYLETSREGNLPWYRRLGFTVVRAGVALVGPGGPTHWTLWREPRHLSAQEIARRALRSLPQASEPVTRAPTSWPRPGAS
jgi:GNAT superfamily N-acetyltransferase